MNKGENGFSDLSRVFIFLLGVTQPIGSDGTVFICHDNNVIITIVYLTLDELQCFFVCGTEKLHTNRHAVQLQERLLHCGSFFSEVLKCRADEDAVDNLAWHCCPAGSLVTKSTAMCFVGYAVAAETLPQSAACHHVALLTPEALLGAGLRPSAKLLDLKGRLRCRGCGRKGRAVVSVKWRGQSA
jgi:HEPN domain-containing protein